MWRLATDA